MIVCQCKGVSDAVIREVIRHGAATVDGVGAACSAGTDCGGCRPTIERLIQIELAPTLPHFAPEPSFLRESRPPCPDLACRQ